MYYVEAILLGSLALLLLAPWFPSRSALVTLITLWMVGVSAIFWRYGLDGQLTFYSNDQQLHVYLMGKLEWGGRPLGVRDLIDRRYSMSGLPTSSPSSALVLQSLSSLSRLSVSSSTSSSSTVTSTDFSPPSVRSTTGLPLVQLSSFFPYWRSEKQCCFLP